MLAKRMMIVEPVNIVVRPAAPWGLLPVAGPPRYQLPRSVNLPFSVNIAAFGPTLETLLRNEPK